MRLILHVLFLLHFINCGQVSKSEEFPTLIFRKSQLLADHLIEYDNLSLYISSNFEKLVGKKYISIENKLESIDNSYFNTDVLGIYQNSNGMVCIISSISGKNQIYQSLDKDFEEILAKGSINQESVRGQFLVNGIETVQFITNQGKIINYKLYIDVLNNTCFQIDYFIPNENFIKFEPVMEASISSISIKRKKT